MIKKFFEIMSAHPSSLNSHELKIQALAGFATMLIMGFMLAFLVFNLKRPYLSLPIFLITFSVGFFTSLSILLWKYFEKNFNMTSTINPNKPSFEAELITFLFPGFGMFIGCCIFGFFLNNIIGFGLGMVFFYPILFIFFRRKTCFNEKSTIIPNKKNAVLGYPIRQYVMLGWVYGFCLIGFGFWCLSFFLYNNTPPLIVCLVLIIFSFILVSLLLSPDLMNKILPFEIREEKGFYLYSFLSIMLSVSLLCIFTILWEIFFPL